MTIERIISGGQTGVDRAALDAALDVQLPVGGWCPKGRRAEDGTIPARYPLNETPTRRYAQRTEWNVRDSDGTLILHEGELRGGTAHTHECAQAYGRPVQVVRMQTADALPSIRRWCAAHHIAVLNVAGPRESEAPGIYAAAYGLLMELLSA